MTSDMTSSPHSNTAALAQFSNFSTLKYSDGSCQKMRNYV